ncbi:MAG: DUF3078 domain-containing protein [bacterium]|nr:DUF3078 domain-containing protein [bacterium]
MKKKMTTLLTIAVFIFPVLCTTGIAQDTTKARWKTSLVTDLTVTQTAYSDSWVGGEAGSVNWVGNLNGAAEKQLSPSIELRSTLKLSFGQTLTQDTAKNWSKPQKSTDLIDFENVARITKDWHVDPYVAFRLESQFVDASFPAKKLYLTPMRFTESAGLARKFYENEEELITSRFGFAIRQTMSTFILDSVTLSTSDTSLTDGGLESVTDATLAIGEKALYTGKLTLFKALFSDADDGPVTETSDYWKAVDVNWESIVSAQLSKVLAVNFYMQILYDKEISKKARIKETIGLGFVFKLV